MPRIRGFPLRGAGGTSRRNRAIVQSAAIGAGSMSVAAVMAYGAAIAVPVIGGIVLLTGVGFALGRRIGQQEKKRGFNKSQNNK